MFNEEHADETSGRPNFHKWTSNVEVLDPEAQVDGSRCDSVVVVCRRRFGPANLGELRRLRAPP
jgi:hypothetical protein